MILTRRHLLTAAAAATLVRPAQAQALPRILFFGDSLTAGFGLRSTEGLVPQLSAWLADAGPVFYGHSASVPPARSCRARGNTI